MHRIRHFLGVLALAFALTGLAPVFAADREEFNVSMRTMVLVIGLSMLGGFVSWIQKVRKGEAGYGSMTVMIGELVTSAFAGFLCYLLCDAWGVSLNLTIMFVGIAGHMGTRAITAFEAFAAKRWGDLSDKTGPQ